MRSLVFLFFLVPVVLLFGCATYTDNIAGGLQAYGKGRMEAALEEFKSARKETGDTHLVDLEQGMAGLALGDADLAIRCFSGAIDRMDVLLSGGGVGDAAAYVLDDTMAEYPGSPFEQISARLFLGMAYLLKPNAFESVSAVCRDMDTKMEQIEAFYERAYSFDGNGEEAKFSFQIPPLAKYFAALAAERRYEMDNAGIYMRQAIQGAPGSLFFKGEAERMEKGIRDNLVFVFTCLGAVPHRIEGESRELTGVLRGIKALYALSKPDNNPNAVDRVHFTAPVKIPVFQKPKPFWHGGYAVKAGLGGREYHTGLAADFDRYARKEYQTLLPGILIRAAVRRVVKETAGQVLGKNVSKEKDVSKLLGDLFSSVAAATETVDTRSWCTLPREFSSAVLALGENDREIVLSPRNRQGNRMGPDIRVPLNRESSEPAFVFVFHPGKGARPIVIVDAAHRSAVNL
jgi:hypothetical protein